MPDKSQETKDKENLKYENYFNRTFNHIQLVQKNALILITDYSEELGLSQEDCRRFAYNVSKHDCSKFNKIQFDAYVNFSWAKKNKKQLSEKEQNDFDIAWRDHYLSERHHPERQSLNSNFMTAIDLLELMCDLQAMADEFGEGSCRNYFESVWIKKQECNFNYNLADWPEIQKHLRKVISCFEDALIKKNKG